MIRLEQVRGEMLERFERVDRRFAQNEQRLSRVDQRLAELTERIDALRQELLEQLELLAFDRADGATAAMSAEAWRDAEEPDDALADAGARETSG
jgi:recombinational DNA repair ATPase RecF